MPNQSLWATFWSGVTILAVFFVVVPALALAVDVLLERWNEQ